MTTKTIKRRINIPPDKEMESAFVSIVKRDKMPVTTKAKELLRLALELEEDVAWSALVEERLANHKKFISHEEAWKGFV